MTILLLKTEPNTFSFDDLVKADVEPWNGVANMMALRNMREARIGDKCVIYHTGDEKACVGLATVVKEHYPDPTLNDAKMIVIDVKVGKRLGRPVTLKELKADPRFSDSPLVRIGRLSAVPLTEEQYAAILELGG
jgi:predicted RNA-binding protein with PUA-like domain